MMNISRREKERWKYRKLDRRGLETKYLEERPMGEPDLETLTVGLCLDHPIAISLIDRSRAR